MADTRSPGFFRNQIYRLYHRNSALAYFLTHRVRPAGILLLLLVPTTWVLIPQRTVEPLFQLRGSIFAILGISLIWAFFRKASVKIRRDLPRLATAGEPLRYRVRVQNTGSKKLAGIKLLDLPPDNRPSYETFIHSKEPGEEKRNIFDRKLAYYRWEWLQRGLTLFSHESSAPLPALKTGETVSTQLSLTPKKRGIIKLADMRVCLPDPLGIFQRCRRTEPHKDKLVVLPHRYRLPPYHIPGNARFQLGGESASSTAGQAGDFTSVRDYRAGDPLRHIHWKSWARTGQAIVKEYEDVFFPRYGLVLDTFVPAHQAQMFEEAVSIAASFAASIDTRESLLDLMFIRDEAHVFSAGRGEERIDSMLEILAGVSCEPSNDFASLEKLVLSYRDNLTACICVFTGWDAQRRDTVLKFQRAGVPLKVFSICRDLDAAQEANQSFPSPLPMTWLRQGHIQEDLYLSIC